MLDHRLRPVKDALLGPLAERLAGRVAPNAVTAMSLVAGLAAAAAAWRGAAWLALALWIANRTLDGLDGAIARSSAAGARGASDLGGYLDLVADFVVYSALPFGIAFGLAPGLALTPTLAPSAGGGAGAGAGAGIVPIPPSPDAVVAVGLSDARTALAVLMASFYVNAAAWLTLSAILEKRAAGGSPDGAGATTIEMPAGIVGGAETAVLFALMLALPDAAIGLMWAMAGLVALAAIQRVAWAVRNLPPPRA